MSWDVEMPIELRHIINDVDIPQTYSDQRLQTAILVGARRVYTELSFTNPYYADIVQNKLTPDPTLTNATGGGPDQWFINMTIYKTGELMLRNNLKVAALTAYTIMDDGIKVDLRSVAQYQQALLKGIENEWENMKMNYSCGARAEGWVILNSMNLLAGGMRAPLLGFSDRDRVIF